MTAMLYPPVVARYLSKKFWPSYAAFLLAAMLAQPTAAQRWTPRQARKARAAAREAAYLTRQDTAQAVHDLFASRRSGGAIFTGAGTIFTGIFTAALVAVPSPSSGDYLGAGASIGTLGILPLGIGVGKLVRYSRAREQQVLTEYASTGHLDRKYRRRLHGNFKPMPGNEGWPIDLPLAGTPVTKALGKDSAVAQVPASSYTLVDSLDAVGALFQAKRLGGQLPTLAVLPAARLLTGSSTADGQYNTSTGQYEDRKASTGAIVAGLALAFGSVTYMFVHNAPYTEAKLAALRTNCEAGAPLPANIRAMLKPQHFEQGRELRNKLLRKEARKNRRQAK